MPTTLITGCSSGFGFETAVYFARKGHRVIATMRNLGKAGPLQELAAKEKLALEVAQLDIEDVASIKRGVAAAGAIDVLVNNAGLAGAAPLEEMPEDEHRKIFEANYWGHIRMMQAVLPGMRARRAGAIVNVTSIAGRLALFNQVAYSASKYALEAASEVLAAEVRAFGIRVAIIEPGIFKTSIFDNAAAQNHYDKQSPYFHIMRRNGKMYGAGLRNPGKVEDVAATIYEAATTATPKLRWLVGEDAFKVVSAREKMTDEQWIALGDAMDDADYYATFKRLFDIELR
jgi:NAD(P)-dependent dehydrogenase (short-subunit alcohol dehydrogenase family)